MKRTFILVILCVIAWAAVMAVPAMHGTRVFTQSDGSTIHLQLTGDEWHHCYVTTDGLTVDRAADGNFYYRTALGLSHVMAHDATQRTAAEAQFVAANQGDMTMQALFTPTQQARRARASVARKASQVPNTGSPRIPVILVQYQDKKFLDGDPKAAWQGQISNPGEVSVYQYFVDQSFGKYTPQFDILGPYTTDSIRSAYGANTILQGFSIDKGVGHMVAEACKGIDASVDWSKYDNNGDGIVDVVIVLYAGDGEASSTDPDAANAIWPLQWDLAGSDYGNYDDPAYQDLVLDGVAISKFAVFNEVYGRDLSKIDGIGVFCHEFSHCLGLPDYYETTNANRYFGMCKWSLMDQGAYNNDGYTPSGYRSYDRYFLGWMDLAEPQEGMTYTEHSVANGGKAYKITTPNPDEIFVIENIEQNGWDEYALSSGLIVNHVTYIEDRWTSNTVNNDSVQLMTIVPADNAFQKETVYNPDGTTRVRFSDSGMAGDLYPFSGNSEISATSTPAFKLNLSSGNLDKAVTAITRNLDGTVTFTYCPTQLSGDVNLDGKVDITDVNLVINIMLGKDDSNNYYGRADINGDGEIDITDVNAIINLMLGKK